MHYALLVVGDVDYDEALAPFNENIDVPPYMEDEADEKYVDDFIEFCNEPQTPINELISKYADKYYEESYILLKSIDDKIYIFTTYNPISKWDWYTINRGFNDLIILKDGTRTYKGKVKDIANLKQLTTWAVLKDGIWYESYKKHDKWSETFYDNFLADLDGETLLTVIDCHI